jgi:hypothetical protein
MMMMSRSAQPSYSSGDRKTKPVFPGMNLIAKKLASQHGFAATGRLLTY